MYRLTIENAICTVLFLLDLSSELIQAIFLGSSSFFRFDGHSGADFIILFLYERGL